ncbi:hypothetical protein JCM10213_005739 [Rhodosporidiobolus nylandii]
MDKEDEQPCCVCGTMTANRCSACADQGGFRLFFCSREHQKLIWPSHKRVCGAASNPFLPPALTPDELELVIKYKDTVLPSSDDPTYADDVASHVFLWAEAGRTLADWLNSFFEDCTSDDFEKVVLPHLASPNRLPPGIRPLLLTAARAAVFQAESFIPSLPMFRDFDPFIHLANFDFLLFNPEDDQPSPELNAICHRALIFFTLLKHRTSSSPPSTYHDELAKHALQELATACASLLTFVSREEAMVWMMGLTGMHAAGLPQYAVSMRYNPATQHIEDAKVVVGTEQRGETLFSMEGGRNRKQGAIGGKKGGPGGAEGVAAGRKGRKGGRGRKKG